MHNNFIFFSCSKENNENIIATEIKKEKEQTNLESISDKEIYKISELPQLPNFARPLNNPEEIRKFTLVKDDGIKLNFNLKSSKQNLFGKMRTCVGAVNEDKKAIMIIGENGFELFFEDLTENDFFVFKVTKS